MCGIAGIFGRPGDLRGDIVRMTDAIAHRGPDGDGCWADAAAGIALGHRRLAVIDPGPGGEQPMVSADGRLTLVFNGEIYNHVELRACLDEERATEWRGHSDTETLLELIRRRGLARALDASVGMFALALWDRESRRLLLARDRIGEKPLYYGWSGGRFLFASELKAMRALPSFDAAIDPVAARSMIARGYVSAPLSIYRDTYKLEPGCLFEIGAEGISSPPPGPPIDTPPYHERRYWSLVQTVSQAQSNPIVDPVAARDALRATLSEAVRLQCLADVPVGAFLSGGIDSSLIVALMRRGGATVRTFTIGFDDPAYDESPYAAAVARHLGTEHHSLVMSASDVRAVIPELPRIYDEPFADASQLPTILVARHARSQVTVALSGDGGDELFGGYNRHRIAPRLASRLASVPGVARRLAGAGLAAVPPGWWRAAGKLPGVRRVSLPGEKAQKLARLLGGDVSLAGIYATLTGEWPDTIRRELDFPALDSEHRLMLWDTLGYLPDDVLVKVDRGAMSASLETRAPFLDHRVVDLAWRLPMAMKIGPGGGKQILRELLAESVPQALTDRPKAGFAIPIGAWLRGPLRDWAEALLARDRLPGEIVDVGAVRQRWAQHLGGSRDCSAALWSVLMFQAWAASQAGR